MAEGDVFLHWRHGLYLGRAADGAVIVQKRAYGPEDVGTVVPADAGPAPAVTEDRVPAADLLALLIQLGVAVEPAAPIDHTPGAAEKPARAPAAEEGV